MKRWAGKALLVGAWVTIVTTVIQIGWMAIIYLVPGWAAWRTPRFWTVCLVSLAYSTGKVAVCLLSRKKIEQRRELREVAGIEFAS